jgi:tetratricopeptide (TPR) repeat protein
MGGIGKTELALQYVRKYWEKSYPGGVCWLEARDRDQDIVTQILDFAGAHLDVHPSEDLSIEARIAHCWSKWPRFTTTESSEEAPAIVIVDDVDDYDAISSYLPKQSRFTLLFTTRRKHLATTITALDIAVLDEFSALNLLKQLAGSNRVEAEEDQAKTLCNWLGYLPLALELVGLYLARRQSLSLSQLQVRLEEQELNATALAKTQPGMTNLLGVASAFELSWKDLKTEIAKKLAYCISIFGSPPVSWAWIEPCFPSLDLETLEDARVDDLLELHLLNDYGDDTYQLHQLVREFLRSKAVEVDEHNEIRQLVANNLAHRAKDIPEDVTQQTLTDFKSVVPHFEEIARNLTDFINEDLFIHLFQGIGRYYKGKGLFELTKEIYKSFKEKSQEKFGDDHLITLRAKYELAAIFYDQAGYENAESLQREILSSSTFSKKGLSNFERSLLADVLNGLGLTLMEKERYLEARNLHEQSLAIRTELFGDEHLDVSDSLNNIALLDIRGGNYPEAEDLLERSLDIRRKVLSEQHPRIATSLNNLAYCNHKQERREVAAKLYTEALSLYKDLHENEHRDTAKVIANLAQLLLEQGKYSNAEPLFLEALRIQEVILGETHTDIFILLSNIAGLYEDLNDSNKAEAFYKRAIRMGQELLGESSSNVAITMNNLAKLYQNNQRLYDAEPLYTKSVQILESNLDEDHPILVKVKDNLESLREILRSEKDIPKDE